jgi:hypothetical protein
VDFGSAIFLEVENAGVAGRVTATLADCMEYPKL